jgi:mono/diheme cytochrome c family protein
MIEALYRFLKSLGYDHPIHSPITHMPIGLITGAFVFFVVALIFKRRQLEMSARHASILALVFAFPTILFGVFDWIHFYHAALIPAIKYKMGLATLVLVLLGLGIALGKAVPLRNTLMTLIYAVSFVAVVGLGYFGGNLVYGQSASSGESASVSARESAAQGAQAGAAAQALAGSGPAAGAVAEGKAIFADNCAGCHQGGGNSIEPGLPVKGSKRLASLDSFGRFLRAPAMPNGQGGNMPPFDEGSLSAAQVKSLYAFVSSAYR